MTRSHFHRSNDNLVAVVVPFSDRMELTEEEIISLQHLRHFLSDYKKYAVVPQGMNPELPDFHVAPFDTRFFGSVKAHNRLMLSEDFYRIFSEHRYILVYHLDSLVFSDKLIDWCRNTDWDYIAPPWVEYRGTFPIDFSRCGNGGFSLRKVESFLNVIKPAKQLVTAEDAWVMIRARRTRLNRLLLQPIRYLLKSGNLNRSWWTRTFYSRNEDRFWSDQAKFFYPDFQVAPIETGLQFAFDDAPAFCYEKNGNRLPFGCHGWHKYNRGFWEPFLMDGI